MTWNTCTQDMNLSWYVPKTNVDHTISGQGTATSTLHHLVTTPRVELADIYQQLLLACLHMCIWRILKYSFICSSLARDFYTLIFFNRVRVLKRIAFSFIRYSSVQLELFPSTATCAWVRGCKWSITFCEWKGLWFVNYFAPLGGKERLNMDWIMNHKHCIPPHWSCIQIY